MDAVERMRLKAWSYGYLRTCTPVIVHSGPFVEVLPANPAFIVVPYYDRAIVFVPPPPGFVMSRAIYCGFGIRLGIWSLQLSPTARPLSGRRRGRVNARIEP